MLITLGSERDKGCEKMSFWLLERVTKILTMPNDVESHWYFKGVQKTGN